MKHYFLIMTDRSIKYQKICETYEEAVKEAPNVVDTWWDTAGTCAIHEVDSNFLVYNVYYFKNGKLTETKVWKED